MFGLRVWKRAEENTVDDGEERGVGTNTEGQNEDGGGSEAGIMAKHAGGVAEVVEERFKERKGALVADAFFGLFEAPIFM